MSRRRTVARSKVVSAVVGLGLMTIAAVGLSLSTPSEDNFQVRAAPLGAAVSYNDGLLQVDDVRVGTTLARSGDSADDTSLSTKGVFVLARVTVRAPDRDVVRVSEARLLAQGTTYTPTTSLFGVTAQPGFQASTDVMFEVDPSRMEDLTLELWTSGTVVGYHQRTHTFLGITAENAEQWASSAQGRKVTADTATTARALT